MKWKGLHYPCTIHRGLDLQWEEIHKLLKQIHGPFEGRLGVVPRVFRTWLGVKENNRQGYTRVNKSCGAPRLDILHLQLHGQLTGYFLGFATLSLPRNYLSTTTTQRDHAKHMQHVGIKELMMWLRGVYGLEEGLKVLAKGKMFLSTNV